MSVQAAKVELAQRDAAADDEKASKVAIREQLKPKMEAWQKGKQVSRAPGPANLCAPQQAVDFCTDMHWGIRAAAVFLSGSDCHRAKACFV